MLPSGIRQPWAGICRLGGIGDNLIAASVLPLLAETYKVEVIAQAPQACVFEHNPYISKLTIKQPGELPSGDAWFDWFRARGKEYAHFVNLSHSCETTLALVKSQSQFQWPAAWRRRYCGHSYLEFTHDVVGVPHRFGRLFFASDDEIDQACTTRGKLGQIDRPVIGWCLSGSRLDKTYPQSAAAIGRLIRELPAQLIMFGAGARDFGLAKQIMQEVELQNGSHDGLHLALSPEADAAEIPQWTAGDDTHLQLSEAPPPLWPIRRGLTQLQTCDLAIGPDTGPMWAVAFESLPKIMLLSHSSPENITKHWPNTVTLHAEPERVPCWPCHQLHDSIETCTPNPQHTGAACISDISVETLVATAKQLLHTT